MTLRCACSVQSDSLRVHGRGDPFDLESHESPISDLYSGKRIWDAPNSAFTIRDGDLYRAIAEPFTSFTLAVAGWTVGASTVERRSSRRGRRASLVVRIVLGVGFDLSVAGPMRIQLPYGASDEQHWWEGGGWAYDAVPGSIVPLNCTIDAQLSSTSMEIASQGAAREITNTNPFTFANGDEIVAWITYGIP